MGQVIAIAAVADNGVIGNRGKLPWNIPEDLKRFKQLTKGNIVLMGRKTFESLNSRPLSNRLNIVVSQSLTTHNSKNLVITNELAPTIDRYSQKDQRDLYIIGGCQIYRQSLDWIERWELTRVDGEFEGDSYLPDIDYSQFRLIRSERFSPRCWAETYIKM
jgi:dihydrofolate reductase